MGRLLSETGRERTRVPPFGKMTTAFKRAAFPVPYLAQKYPQVVFSAILSDGRAFCRGGGCQHRGGRRLGEPLHFEACAIAERAVRLRQLTRMGGTDLSRFTFVMGGMLMSASTKVAEFHSRRVT
jgi:hypothetical protein